MARIPADDMATKHYHSRSFKGSSTVEFEINYLLFLPQGYEQEDSKRWPLMLFLHGAGERGTNLSRVAVHGPPKVVRTQPGFPFILVSPQCRSGETWSDAILLALLDEIIRDHRVDANRVYLTGLSMGGYGTWSLGLRHPRRFAAMAPICGGGDVLPVLLPPQGEVPALRTLPIWAFHGAKDPLVPLSESERMVEAMKRGGNPNVKLTVYPEAGHDCWTETYNNPELYEWFLSHSRPKNSARIRRKMKSAAV